MKALILLLLSLYFSIANAQDPGSVSGQRLWLIAPSKKEVGKLKIKEPSSVGSTHFNFNRILDGKDAFKRIKSIVSDRYSLFVVFKSDSEDKLPVATITKGRSKVYISNKEVLSSTAVEYKKVDSKKGILLSLLSTNTSSGRKNNSLVLEDFYLGDAEGRQQLMEVIYYPRLLTPKERVKVETYLSLKYGLSLLGGSDYINSSGEKIWDTKLNGTFASRVTGIGRDDAFGLYQKQSGNAEKDGLYLGLGIVDTTNALNTSILADKSFMLWGDNGGKLKMVTDKENANLRIMERQWLINLSGNLQEPKTQLVVNKKEMGISHGENDFLWLCIGDKRSSQFDYTNSHYYRQSSEDDNHIYFNDIKWDQDRDGIAAFTFVTGPDFIVQSNASLDCESQSGKIRLVLNGGTPPYQIGLTSVAANHNITTADSEYEFSGLGSSEYTITVRDSKNKVQSSSVVVDPFSDLGLSLDREWILDGEEVMVTPSINGKTENIVFEWSKGGNVLGGSKEFRAYSPGDYTLKITNASGCSKEIPFKVLSGDTTSGWIVYPNPTRMSEPFSIRFNLKEESDVHISINSIEGKQFINRHLGRIREFTQTESISTAGVYMVTVTIGEISTTVKLIIN